MLVHVMRFSICEECRYALFNGRLSLCRALVFKIAFIGEEITKKMMNDVTMKKRVNANKKCIHCKLSDYS